MELQKLGTQPLHVLAKSNDIGYIFLFCARRPWFQSVLESFVIESDLADSQLKGEERKGLMNHGSALPLNPSNLDRLAGALFTS